MGKITNKVGCFKCEQHGEMKNVDLCTQMSIKCDRIRNKICWATNELSLSKFFRRVTCGGKIKNDRLEFPGKNGCTIPLQIRVLKNETFKKEASKVQKAGEDVIVLQTLKQSTFDGKAILYLNYGWMVSISLVPQDRGDKQLCIDKRYEKYNILGGIRITKHKSLEYTIELQLFAGSGHYMKCLNEATIRIGRLKTAICDEEHNIFKMNIISLNNKRTKTYCIKNTSNNNNNNINTSNNNNNNNNYNSKHIDIPPDMDYLPPNFDLHANDIPTMQVSNPFDDIMSNNNNNNNTIDNDMNSSTYSGIYPTMDTIISDNYSSVSDLSSHTHSTTSSSNHSNIIEFYKQELKSKDKTIQMLNKTVNKYRSFFQSLKQFDIDKPITTNNTIDIIKDTIHNDINTQNNTIYNTESDNTINYTLPHDYGFPVQYNTNNNNNNNNGIDYNVYGLNYSQNYNFYPNNTDTYIESTLPSTEMDIQTHHFDNNTLNNTNNKFSSNTMIPVKRSLQHDIDSNIMCSPVKKQRLNNFDSSTYTNYA